MIKVLRHGNKISVRNPVSGIFEDMVNVTFVEIGRSGGNAQMSDTSAFLSQLAGEAVGLSNFRIHTHPLLAGTEGKFPVGSEHPGHINRRMYSTPQIRQQENVDPQMVDGRPTYFTTWISAVPEEDVDLRVSNEALLASDPDALKRANVNRTEVRVIEEAQNSGDPEGILAALTGQRTNVTPRTVANQS